MAGQVFMLIECPNCFALMRGPAKYCRRCGHELPATPPATAAVEVMTPAMLKRKMRWARIFCVIGIILVIWGLAAGSVDRCLLGAFMFFLPRPIQSKVERALADSSGSKQLVESYAARHEGEMKTTIAFE
jgi:hypothetical protein